MNIAFCKFAGMGNGGCEKYLQSIALLYKQRGHGVNYFYTNAAPSIGSSFVHPDNNADRIALLESKDITLTKINVGSRSVSLKEFKWIDTNFPDLFREKDYEYMVTAGDGRAEYPYTDLHDIKIIHTVHGSHPFNKPNIVKSGRRTLERDTASLLMPLYMDFIKVRVMQGRWCRCKPSLH